MSVRLDRPGPRRSGAATGRRREVTDDGDTFFRTVDRALGTYLSLRPAPLVLVGASRTVSRFTYTATVVNPFGNLLRVMHNPHYRETLAARSGA